MIDQHFVILGTLISFVGGSAYVLRTLQGKTQPNRVTWFMWALAPMIAFAAELKSGVGLQSLMTFTVGFMPLLVFIASFVNSKSEWKITRFDIWCGLLSLLGLSLWIITRHSDIAILFAIMADALAAIPTIVKSYKHPESESASAFWSGGTNAGITLLTIDHWTFAHYGFPLYILTICVILVALIRFKLGERLQLKFAQA